MNDQIPIETKSTGARRVEPGDVEIGRRIHAFRRRRRMSLADLGKAVDVSYQQIQKYEKGVNRVGMVRLQAIAGTLGVTLADLVGSLVGSDPLNASWSSDPQAMQVAMDFASISDPVVRASVAALMASLAESR